MTDETELLPCPFCGPKEDGEGQPEIEEIRTPFNIEYRIACQTHECETHTFWFEVLEEAIEAWQTRAPDPVADTSKSCRTNTSNNGMTDFHPGEILLCDFVIPDLAMNLGLTDEQEDELYDIFDGVAPVSETMALIFSQVFDTTPELWMNLQRAYDEKTTERQQSEKTPNGNNRMETDGNAEDITGLAAELLEAGKEIEPGVLSYEDLAEIGAMKRKAEQAEELAAVLRECIKPFVNETHTKIIRAEAKAALEKYEGGK